MACFSYIEGWYNPMRFVFAPGRPLTHNLRSRHAGRHDQDVDCKLTNRPLKRGNLTASTIARLREVWADEHTRWQKRMLSVKRYVYFWADGIHLQARLEDEKQCMLGAHRRDAGRPKESSASLTV